MSTLAAPIHVPSDMRLAPGINGSNASFPKDRACACFDGQYYFGWVEGGAIKCGKHTA